MAQTSNVLRIGTRRSPLAMAQSQWVGQAMARLHAGLSFELVPIITSGDRYFGPLHTAGGKGLFTAELESALRDGSIDLAVHSAKDLPAEMADDLCIAAVPAREDPRDALVSSGGGGPESLAAGAVVGTSSLRRGMQLLALRPDVKVVPLRGNVETRMKKVLKEHAADATLLAMAGLIRSGLLEAHRRQVHVLEVSAMVPAAGQGVLAIQAAAGNARARSLAIAMEDPASAQALAAERSVVRAMHADCRSSLGAHVRPDGDGWEALAAASRLDGRDMKRYRTTAHTVQQAADALTDEMLRDGVPDRLKS